MRTKSIGLAGSALLSLALLSACATAPRDGVMSPTLVKAAETSGDAAINASQPAQAAGLYERAYRAAPSADLAVRWGRALRLSGQPQSGVINLKEAERKFPNDAALLTELGRCAAVGGYPQEAAEAFSRATSSRGANWATYMASGAFQAETGNAVEAHGLFARAENAARSDRERYASQANQALLRAQSGDLAGGIADLEQITSHPGVDAKAHADLALLYGLSGNTQGYAKQMAQSGLESNEAARVGSWLDGGDPDAMPRVANNKPHRVAPTHAQTVQWQKVHSRQKRTQQVASVNKASTASIDNAKIMQPVSSGSPEHVDVVPPPAESPPVVRLSPPASSENSLP